MYPIYQMKKVLVVDDDQSIVEVVKYILTSKGFDVHTLDTGINILEIVLVYDPNLILLDIRLPGKSGIEICKELKQQHSDLRIILFSAHADHKMALHESGADSFIKKPFDVGDFINTIRSYMN